MSGEFENSNLFCKSLLSVAKWNANGLYEGLQVGPKPLQDLQIFSRFTRGDPAGKQTKNS